jgi:hypothetical protein
MQPQETIDQLTKVADSIEKITRGAFSHAPTIISLLWTSWCAVGLSFWRPFDYRFALVCASCFLTVFVLSSWWYARRPYREAKHFAKRLGKDEKMVLQLFLRQGASTRHVNMFYAPTASLIAKQLLVNATSIVPPLKAPVVIEPHVLEYLRKHPELVDLKKEELGIDDYEDEHAYLTRP